jgi:subtilisin-like proprotein convertase family protein
LIHLEAPAAAFAPLQPGRHHRDDQRLAAVRDAIQTSVDAFAPAIAAGDIIVERSFRLQPTIEAVVSPAGLEALSRDPGVRFVEPDRRWRLQTIEGLELIGASELHQLDISGEGTAVAIIDSGVDYNHPSLGGGQIPNAKVVYGLDTGDGDDDPMDCNGHGSAVASVAAGSSHQWSPTRRFGGGVAPAAKILAYKVTTDSECGIATTGAVVEAIEDAILRRHGEDYDLAAINISLGGGAFSGPCDGDNPTYAAAVNAAVEAGIAVVAAAGNSGYPDAMNAPACLSRAISVGSVWDVDPGWVPYLFCLDDACNHACDDSYRWRGAVACYSNSGRFLDLMAPSEYLRAAESGGVTIEFGGTSGAAAYVTGAAALLAQSMGGGDPNAIRYHLAATGEPTMDDKNGLVRPVIHLGAAAAATTVFTPQEASLPIRHGPGVLTRSTIDVDGTGTVGHLEVYVDIVHPAAEHLRLTLSSPDGTSVLLHDQTSSPEGLAGSYPNDLAPVEPLALFSGLPAAGSWMLTIEDGRVDPVADRPSQLVGWALKLVPPSPPVPENVELMYPVVAHTRGALDTDWRSDIRLFNAAGDREARLRLHLIPPSGSYEFEPRQTDIVVPHSSILALNDVVLERLGFDSARGSLVIESDQDQIIHGSSRTYTTAGAGTFGQFVAPIIGGQPASAAGDTAIVILPPGGEGHRLNLGLVEVSGHPILAAVTLVDSQTGSSVGSSLFTQVEAFANLQLNDILSRLHAENAVDPYVAVSAVQGDGRLTAYGSLVDNLSGDAVFVIGSVPRTTPYLLVPVVAHTAGQAGTRWRSDLRVLNDGDFSINIDAEFRLRGSYGVPPVVESFELRPGQAMTIDDVVHTLFELDDAVGSLRLVSREGPAVFHASSRTANHGSTDGAFGQYVPAIRSDDGLREAGVLLHLAKGPDSRSNVGLVETAGGAVTLELTLFDEDGRAVGGVQRRALGPWELVQINDVFSALGAPALSAARLDIVRVSGEGSFFAYASVVDTTSGDAIFVPVSDHTRN